MTMPRKDPALCCTIRDRVDKWEKYWTINRSLYYEWVDFVMGDQWREDESKLFERYNKIPLVFNKLGVLMNHLEGDQIQNTPNLQIVPDKDVPVRTAEVRSALIRDISLNSNAKAIYQRCFGRTIVGGYAAMRVGLDYLDDNSFDKEILIYDIEDPNRCYWDIAAKEVSKTDGMWSGFKTRISRQKFRDRYGKNLESQIGTTAITEDSTIAFADDDSITQLDDYERIGKKTTIYKLSDMFTVVDEEEFRKLPKEKLNGKKYVFIDDMPMTVIDKRPVVKYKVKHRQIAGDFVLEEEDFPSQRLPIVFIDQKSYYSKQGQQITRSFFKDVKDAQKYLNYLATQSAYIMKISRYDQFIMPRKCAASPDAQQQWRDPSVVNGALYYDETPSGAKPEQLRPPELSQSLTMQYERTLMDIQSGTGMFNAQMGDVGNEISGDAIDGRRKAGSKNTRIPYNSIDNAISEIGEIINEMIPEVYDTERDLILNMPEAESQKISINKQNDDYGISVENDMTKGRYKIRLKPGLSYEGQKAEALQSLQLVLGADKSGQIFPMIADLYAENLPLDNNLEIRNRLRTIVSPEIIEAGKTGKPLPPKQEQPSPDVIKMQLMQEQLAQKREQAENDFMLKIKDLELKQAEIQRKSLETHQDMTMAWEKMEADKEMAAAQLQETLLRYEAELKNIETSVEMNTANNLVKLLTHHSKNKESKNLPKG